MTISEITKMIGNKSMNVNVKKNCLILSLFSFLACVISCSGGIGEGSQLKSVSFENATGQDLSIKAYIWGKESWTLFVPNEGKAEHMEMVPPGDDVYDGLYTLELVFDDGIVLLSNNLKEEILFDLPYNLFNPLIYRNEYGRKSLVITREFYDEAKRESSIIN